MAVHVPTHAEVRIEEAALADMQPAEYRADLVLSLRTHRPALGIIVEAQLQRDTRKRYAWPLYATGLRARLRCPVVLCVLTPKRNIARWAATPIRLGGGNVFEVTVIGPAAIPAITEPERAQAQPELAVLSAIAHGKDADHERAARIADAAVQASLGLEPDRSMLYCDLVFSSLSEAARKLLQAMDPAKYEYQSEIARRWFAAGRAEGEAAGRAEGEAAGRVELLLKLLEVRFGPLDPAQLERVRGAAADDIQRWATRLLAGASLTELFD
jgi:hypothetical protein